MENIITIWAMVAASGDGERQRPSERRRGSGVRIRLRWRWKRGMSGESEVGGEKEGRERGARKGKGLGFARCSHRGYTERERRIALLL